MEAERLFGQSESVNIKAELTEVTVSHPLFSPFSLVLSLPSAHPSICVISSSFTAAM